MSGLAQGSSRQLTSCGPVDFLCVISSRLRIWYRNLPARRGTCVVDRDYFETSVYRRSAFVYLFIYFSFLFCPAASVRTYERRIPLHADPSARARRVGGSESQALGARPRVRVIPKNFRNGVHQPAIFLLFSPDRSSLSLSLFRAIRFNAARSKSAGSRMDRFLPAGSRTCKIATKRFHLFRLDCEDGARVIFISIKDKKKKSHATSRR